MDQLVDQQPRARSREHSCRHALDVLEKIQVMSINDRPAWQTDDLDEEWVDEEEEEEEASLGTQSISLTTPLPAFLQTPSAETSPDPAGTFLVRDDMPVAAFLPKTPARQIKKGPIKDIFSPLALERMFEPPSPPPQKPLALALTAAPAIPSRLSQAFTPNDSRSDSDTSTSVDPARLKPTSSTDFLAPPSSALPTQMPTLEGPFTFSVPRQNPRFPQAESTPGHVCSAVNPPITDPRLRLFQLQYDTFTRDHLSAMVDSIAVNTPSGGSAEGNASSSSPLQRVLFKPQQTPVSDDTPIRSVKRIKLSPPCDFYGEGAGAGAVVSRPRDYVGESRSLMQQIKQARDFSTFSTNTTTRTPATDKSQVVTSAQVHPNGESVPLPCNPFQLWMLDNRATLMPVTSEKSGSITGSSTAAPSGHSSLALRLQAANLMQQIKNDMRGSKRLFSGDTELSRYTYAEDERANLSASVLDKSQQSVWSSGSHERSRRKSPKTGSPRRPSSASRHHPSPRKFSRSVSDDREHSLVLDMSNMSIEAPWQTEARSVTTHANLPPNINIPSIRVTSSTIVDAFPQPPTQIPRSYPSSSLRSGNNDDLNRFVSSSTASGTTITASSAPSFVKHAGPVHITHITPSDVPSLPQRVGKMVYDKNLMKWMRASTRISSEGDDVKDHVSVTDAESEDPFRDIDSLREDDSGGTNVSRVAGEEAEEVEEEAHFKQDATRIEEGEGEDANDQEEVDLTSFTFDGPSVAVDRSNPSRGDDTGDDTTVSDSEQGDGAAADADNQPVPMFCSEDDLSHDSPNQRPVPPVEATPVAPRRVSTVVTPMPPKSALKSTSATPVSALKDPNRDKHRTPAQRLGHRRSVSFSDGKRDGPIRGLTMKSHESDDDLGTSVSSLDPTQSSGYSPSARTKRIVEMMRDLENTSELGVYSQGMVLNAMASRV